MRLHLTDDDVAFREEMRTFFTTKVPQDIRDTLAARGELSKDQMVRSMQSMNAAGIAVPGWPVEWGGQDWSPLRRHIWGVEMQLACVPPPLAFNAGMIGPVIAAFAYELVDVVAWRELNEARLLALGLALVVVVRFLPGGLPEVGDHLARLLRRNRPREEGADAA